LELKAFFNGYSSEKKKLGTLQPKIYLSVRHFEFHMKDNTRLALAVKANENQDVHENVLANENCNRKGCGKSI